jgi:hypothetical protein
MREVIDDRKRRQRACDALQHVINVRSAMCRSMQR